MPWLDLQDYLHKKASSLRSIARWLSVVSKRGVGLGDERIAQHRRRTQQELAQMN
jgi:hypothetical protein